EVDRVSDGYRRLGQRATNSPARKVVHRLLACPHRHELSRNEQVVGIGVVALDKSHSPSVTSERSAAVKITEETKIESCPRPLLPVLAPCRTGNLVGIDS